MKLSSRRRRNSIWIPAVPITNSINWNYDNWWRKRAIGRNRKRVWLECEFPSIKMPLLSNNVFITNTWTTFGNEPKVRVKILRLIKVPWMNHRSSPVKQIHQPLFPQPLSLLPLPPPNLDRNWGSLQNWELRKCRRSWLHCRWTMDVSLVRRKVASPVHPNRSKYYPVSRSLQAHGQNPLCVLVHRLRHVERLNQVNNRSWIQFYYIWMPIHLRTHRNGRSIRIFRTNSLPVSLLASIKVFNARVPLVDFSFSLRKKQQQQNSIDEKFWFILQK